MVAAADDVVFDPLDSDEFKVQTRRIRELLSPVIPDFGRICKLSALRPDPHHLSIGVFESDVCLVAIVTIFWRIEHRWSKEDIERAVGGYARSLLRIGQLDSIRAHLPVWLPDDPDRIRLAMGEHIGSIELHEMQTTVSACP